MNVCYLIALKIYLLGPIRLVIKSEFTASTISNRLCILVQQAGAATVPAAGPLISRRCTECKDHVDAFKWTCADVSRDGEYICAAAVAADKHIIYVWQAAGGHIASVLEGPEGGLDWCGWHPDPGRCVAVVKFIFSIYYTGITPGKFNLFSICKA